MIQAYDAISPGNVLEPFIPELRRLAAAGESVWLDAFFNVRIDDLPNPANSATQAEWSQSVDRVECLRWIAATGNYTLDGPLNITAFGWSYTINR